jgi:hypothetical protein
MWTSRDKYGDISLMDPCISGMRDDGQSSPRPCDPDWRVYDRLVHATRAAPNRSIPIIRTIEVHDQEFYTRLGMRRQYAWLLWHSKIALSWDMAQRLHQEFGISFEELGQVEREIPAKPRGRPPKPLPTETPKGRQRRPRKRPREEGTAQA